MEHKQTTSTEPQTPTGPWSVALTSLYMNHFESLVRVAQRILCDAALAEECVQDAFITFHLKGPSPRPGHEVAYLRSMVRNGAISKLRREVRLRRNLPTEPLCESSAETQAITRLVTQVVSSRIAKLPRQQVTALRLRVAGVSVVESAQTMDVSVGTVKTHRHRAAEALRPHIGELLAA